MPRYFLHLRNGVDEVLDELGQEFATVEALRQHLLLAARGLMGADLHKGIIDFRFRIDAENETGQLVYSLPFKDAVNIISEQADGGRQDSS